MNELSPGRRRRLLAISYPFPPNASAGSVRSERFARLLPRHGWDVEVITIEPRADLFADRARLESLGDGVRVRFTPIFDPWLQLKQWNPTLRAAKAVRSAGMRLTSFPDHVVFWVPSATREGLRAAREGGFDAIYTTSPPHSTHLIGLLISRMTGKPWVADFRDPWTLNATRESGFVERVLLGVERAAEVRVLRRASAILANTKANRDNLLRAFSFLSPEKVVYAPNGWEEFPPVPAGSAGSGPLKIVHSGIFYPKFRPFALLHALQAWRAGGRSAGLPPMPDLKVILLGCGDGEVGGLVRELGLGDLVEIRPWVALEEARRCMRGADLLWTTLGTGKAAATFVPSKLYEYIAAERPILGFFPRGEAESLIRDTGTGIVFESDEPAPVIQALHEAALAKERGEAPGFFSPRAEAIAALKVEKVVERVAESLGGACRESVV